MGNQTPPVQPTAHEQRIEASSLRAVIGARAFGGNHTKWYALSSRIDAGSCGSGWRNSWSYRRQLGVKPLQIKAGIHLISSLYLINVVEKVKAHHGAAEVKRTWGIGYRALLAQLKTGGAA